MPRRADPETDLWQRAMRDVKRLAPRATPPPPRPAKRVEKPPIHAPAPTPDPTLPPLAPGQFAGIDRANAERLKRGKHPVEARLDLHGMTQDEAHRALASF